MNGQQFMNGPYGIPDFIDIINNVPSNPKPEVNLMDTLNEFMKDSFYKNINNLDQLSPSQRLTFIKSNIDLISEHIINAKCSYAHALFTPTFLEAYLKVLSSIPINGIRRFASNYLYYTFKTNSKYNQVDREMKRVIHGLFFSISRVVNREQIRILETVGVPSDYATELCAARNSSTDEVVNAFRVNLIISCSRDPLLFTEQMIIYVFEKLYDQMRYLFLAIMLDPSDNYANDYPDDEDAFYYVFSNIELAVLTMANNLPMDGIDRLLRIYAERWNSLGKPKVRFSLRVLSADFGRVLAVAEKLTANGVYIP